MKKQGRELGGWEFGCLVFHACFYKMFTTYPNQFFAVGGTAGWLTALYTGLIFVGLFIGAIYLVKHFHSRIPHSILQVGKVVLALYWLLSTVYALSEFTYVLRDVAFPRSPVWFLGGILLLGAIATAIGGGKAVYRMHSLSVLGIGLAMSAVAVLGTKYAEMVYLTPWLGKGAGEIFGTGLTTLFFYTDSILIFQLAPRCRKNVSVYRSGIVGAALAVALNVALVLISSMSRSFWVNEMSDNLIYPLIKAAYFGGFWSRMDGIYLVALTVSAFLYLSMAVHLFFLAIRNLEKIPRKSIKTAALCLAGCLCVTLSGCYDNREVEAAAYTIALGIDKGEEKQFQYTFQLSNPLELGGSMEPSAQKSGGEEEKENKSVTNLVMEEDNFYLAINRLKSHLSKEPDFSHLKLVVFSTEVAKEGLLEHAIVLYEEREVRPATRVCLTKSAKKFLGNVKPSLEQSTARYYELLFQNRNTPFAPVVELREFVSRSTDGGWDPVLPVATSEKLTGIGIFQKGRLVATMDEKAAMLYGLLSGSRKEVVIQAGDSTFLVQSKCPPKFGISEIPEGKRVTAKVTLTAKRISGREASGDLVEQLEREATAFLQKTIKKKADVLGVGAWLRYGVVYQEDWMQLNWHKELGKLQMASKICLKE